MQGQEEIFFPSHRFQTGSGAHPASYPTGIGSLFGVKRPEREADHSSPSSTEIKNVWRYTSTPPYVFMTRYVTGTSAENDLGIIT
jgi:hypothetical protein